MKPEHRSLLAVVLSIGVLVIWFSFFAPKPVPRPENKNGTSSSETVQQAETVVPLEQKSPALLNRDPQGSFSIETTTIEHPLYTAELSNDGGEITSWRIHGYRRSADPKSLEIDLAADAARKGIVPPLHLTFLNASFIVPEKPRYRLVSASNENAVYLWRSSEVEIKKTLTFQPNRYGIDVEVEVTNLTKQALEERPLLRWGGMTELQKDSGGFFSFLKPPVATNKQPIYYLDGEVHREVNLTKIPESVEKSGTLYWAGIEDRYFLTAVIPRIQASGVVARYGSSLLSENSGARSVEGGVALAKATIPPGGTIRHAFSVFAGPKEIDQLKAVGVRLEEAIDYGWFTLIAVPILYLLKFFSSLIHNYGIAIILLTIFIKLLLHPISKKSMKSMKAMQKLQPKLKELQEKFKNDKARLQQETMQLFKTHKVNPAGGCLPMLLQFPVYIALYKVLWNSIELYHAPFFWFYKDLSAPDPYLVGPILLGIFMVAQQKLMPSASADPAQKKMMMIMPVMFSGFMIFLPSGLVIYILVNTVMSVLQQWMYNHDIRFRDLLRGKLSARA